MGTVGLGVLGCVLLAGTAVMLITVMNFAILIEPMSQLASVAPELDYAVCDLELSIGLVRAQTPASNFS
jgi:hypothetical protein